MSKGSFHSVSYTLHAVGQTQRHVITQCVVSFLTLLLLVEMLIYGIIRAVFLLLAMVGHDE